MKHTPSLSRLSNADLLRDTHTLAGRERRCTALLVAHLAELDARKLYRSEGSPSLYMYCTTVLHFSEYAAYNRIAAARAARKFPLVLELLATGELHLAAVSLLAPHLTPENHRSVLRRARHRSKRQVESLVAELAPRPALQNRVCPASPAKASPEAAVNQAGAERPAEVSVASDSAQSEGASEATVEARGSAKAETRVPSGLVAQNAATPPSTAEPLSPHHTRLHLTADAETMELLREAQDLLAHQVPDRDPAAILKLALAELVRKTKLRKVGGGRKVAASGVVDSEVAVSGDAASEAPVVAASGGAPSAEDAFASSVPAVPATSAPQATAPKPAKTNSRYIRAAVRRAVWQRDGARCAFRGRNGMRCAETGRLEFHHVRPFALGGGATVENIALRCRAHNGYEAETAGLEWPTGVRERYSNWPRGQLEGSRPGFGSGVCRALGETIDVGSAG